MTSTPKPPPPPPKPPAGPKTPPPPAGPKGALHSVRQVAAMWECSPHLVYNLISTGDLQYVDIGSGRKAKVRIAASELEAYIARKQRRAPRAERAA